MPLFQINFQAEESLSDQRDKSKILTFQASGTATVSAISLTQACEKFNEKTGNAFDIKEAKKL